MLPINFLGIIFVLYLDLKYLNFISCKLDGFTPKRDNVFTCRCPFCGDSQKDLKKKRGYIYSLNNSLRYFCHNCAANHSFYNFIELIDPFLFDQYRVELFKEKYGTTYIQKQKPEEVFEPPKIDIAKQLKERKSLESIFYSICTPISDLPPDNPAVKYFNERKIPKIQSSRVFYIDDTLKLKKLDPNLDIKFGEERLVLPFFDKNNKLLGLTCRSLNKKSKLRYMMVNLTDATQVFGLDKINPSKTIYAVEGPIDSLFLPNSIAVSGTAFGKIDSILKELNIAPDQVVLVIDNQPRNKEVTAIQSKLIDMGYTVVVWDIDDSLGKDINDLIIKSNFSIKEVHQIIKRCTTRGLEARMKFNQWKKC